VIVLVPTSSLGDRHAGRGCGEAEVLLANSIHGEADRRRVRQNCPRFPVIVTVGRSRGPPVPLAVNVKVLEEVAGFVPNAAVHPVRAFQ